MANAPAQLRIPLGEIDLSPLNPRQDLGDLTDLVASIKDLGVLEPIVVVERAGRFHAITGSRRIAASKKAGVKDMPVRVMDLTEAQAAAAALVENLHRKDLNPIEEAEGYRDYLALTGKTQEELAKTVGRVRSTITNALRLLEAPSPVRVAIQSGVIGAAHGLELLRLEDPNLAANVLKTASDLLKPDRAAGDRKDEQPKPDKTIPLRIINELVDRANEKSRRGAALAALPALLKRRQAELEAKKIIVTWEPARDYDKEWSVATYLGKPPVAIALAGYELTAWKKHAKECGCNAVALTVENHYQKGRSVENADVCVNAAAAKKQRRASGRGGQPRRDPKEVERQKREQVQGALEVSAFRPKDLTAKNRAVIAKLSKKDLGTEVARLVLFSMSDQRWWGGKERLMLWESIDAMPLAKVKAKIVALSVGNVIPTVSQKHHIPGKNLPHLEPMLARYHLTLADADLLPKLALDAKPKVAPAPKPKTKTKKAKAGKKGRRK